MKETYCPVDPVFTPAFEDALQEHRADTLEILLGAYALQELVGDAFDNHGPVRFEVLIEELEVALGCGSDAAIKCAKMSGFRQIACGHWVLFDGEKGIELVIPQDLIKQFTHGISEHL